MICGKTCGWRILRGAPAWAALALASCALATAQDNAQLVPIVEQGEIETDRDSFTFATSTVAPCKSILEASYSFIDNRVGPESHSFPELLARRGVAEGIELRLGWNYEAGGPGTVSGSEVGGEDLQVETAGHVLYGAKFQTSKPTGWMPESALIVQADTPTSGPSSVTNIDVGEAWGWKFANGWIWNSSLRYATGNEKGDAFNQWAPSTVLKIPVGERYNVHAEYFGIISSGKADNLNRQYASFGGHVLLSPNFELGIRFGFGLNQDTPRFFNNVGIGWQF